MGEQKDLLLPSSQQKGVTRREVLKRLAGVGAGLLLPRQILTSEPILSVLAPPTVDQLPPEVASPMREINLTEFMDISTDEGGETVLTLQWERLAADTRYKEYVVKRDDEHFRGWVICNPQDELLVVSLGEIQQSHLKTGMTTIHKGAFTNIAPEQYSDRDGFGETTAALVFEGNIALVGQTIDQKDNNPILDARKADRGIYFTSRKELEDAYDTGSVEGVNIVGYNPFKKGIEDPEHPDSIFACPAPAGIAADNCDLRVKNVMIDGSLEKTDLPALTEPDRHDLLRGNRSLVENYIHPAEQQVARGIVANYTQPKYGTVELNNVFLYQTLWDGAGTQGNANTNMKDCIFYQDMGMRIGVAFGAVHNGREGTVIAENCVFQYVKGIWNLNQYSQADYFNMSSLPDQVRLQNVNLRTRAWSLRPNYSQKVSLRDTTIVLGEELADPIFNLAKESPVSLASWKDHRPSTVFHLMSYVTSNVLEYDVTPELVNKLLPGDMILLTLYEIIGQDNAKPAKDRLIEWHHNTGTTRVKDGAANINIELPFDAIAELAGQVSRLDNLDNAAFGLLYDPHTQRFGVAYGGLLEGNTVSTEIIWTTSKNLPE